jgi:hypothetical protein
MKKRNAVIICILVLGISGWYLKKQRIVEEETDTQIFGKEIYLDAKSEEFKSLADVEKNTDAIVIAQKIAQDSPTISYGAEGRIAVAYTLSTFQIKEILVGEKLKADTTFTLLENEAYDKEQDRTYHIAGYNLINKQQDYLLFLRQSETDPYYLITGINYGKVNLKASETDYPKGLNEATTEYSQNLLLEYHHQEQIRAEARKKYAQEY